MNIIHNRGKILILIAMFFLTTSFVKKKPTHHWESALTGTGVSAFLHEPAHQLRDYNGNCFTVVYLTNLPFENISTQSNKKNIASLLSEGYRVVELDYKRNQKMFSPTINKEIIAINDSLGAGSFLGLKDCSYYRSYVLLEGYRIKRDVAYYKDDPSVYNTPKEYTEGDSLYMDIIYPVNPKKPVPVLLSFSYSNSYATYDSDKKCLIDANKHQRLKQAYTLAGFNDSFLEGAPARGMAWAIADHPKYCDWGKGKVNGGANDGYKSFQTNPDAVRKVKSAVRTLRAEGANLGLSGEIGIYGFSRGSTAGSLAIGGKQVSVFSSGGLHSEVSEKVQAAALGSGVFNYTLIYQNADDGDKQLELRCPWVWGALDENRLLWNTMGSEYLVEDATTAPVLFFYNTTDEKYYQSQIKHLKNKLDSLQVPNESLIDYGIGHSVPQSTESLQVMYKFFERYLY